MYNKHFMNFILKEKRLYAKNKFFNFFNFFMLKIIVVSFLGLSSFLFSQGINIIEYQFNFYQMEGIKSYVVADQNESYFFFSQRKDMTFENLNEKDSKINKNYVFNYNFENKFFLETMNTFQRDRAKNATLVKDDALADTKWIISNKKKNILNYKCTLATADFRGRKYKVWFTTELSSNLFPWKLKGLPGAILEFEDDEGIFSGEAIKIGLNLNIKIPEKVLSYFSKNARETAISQKDFLKIDNKYLQELQNQDIASQPKGSNSRAVPIRSGRLEKSFEWETQPERP